MDFYSLSQSCHPRSSSQLSRSKRMPFPKVLVVLEEVGEVPLVSLLAPGGGEQGSLLPTISQEYSSVQTPRGYKLFAGAQDTSLKHREDTSMTMTTLTMIQSHESSVFEAGAAFGVYLSSRVRSSAAERMAKRYPR